MSGGGEKTQPPSAKRLREAAKRGDVLRSRELASAVAVGAGALWLHWAGGWMLASMAQGLRRGLVWDRAAIEHFAPGDLAAALGWATLPPLLLLAGGTALIVVISQLGFGEGRWNAGNALPKASRINPAAGLKRMFGMQGWIELAKGLAKVALLGTIAWVWSRQNVAVLLTSGRGPLGGQLLLAWDALTGLLFALAAGLAVIALIDFPVQWWRRRSRLMMTLEEVRDEHKEAEGSPENKAAQRSRQRQIAMGGVVHALKEAQFVLTNPTHFAVALAYDPAKAGAPVVLAKGRGDKALAIRELAGEMGVPVLEYPALARSVYFTTRENQVIREELYAAVASILAFVFALRRGEDVARPQVAVPVTVRFDADGRPQTAAAA